MRRVGGDVSALSRAGVLRACSCGVGVLLVLSFWGEGGIDETWGCLSKEFADCFLLHVQVLDFVMFEG